MWRKSWRKLAAVVSLSFALVIPKGANAANTAPELQKVFVYAGTERIRLVAIFNKTLGISRPRPLVRGEALTLFLTGARGGKPLRYFEVGQGGYTRLEALEKSGGLWLRVKGRDIPSSLQDGANVSVDGSAVTLTLPVLVGSLKGSLAKRGFSRDRKAVIRPAVSLPAGNPRSADISRMPKGNPLKAAPREGLLSLSGKEEKKSATTKLTPESVLNKVLSAPALPVEAAASSIRSSRSSSDADPPLTSFDARLGKRIAPGTAFPNEPARTEIRNMNSGLINVAIRTTMVLGGILALIFTTVFLFKKFAPQAASRLGGTGKLVRTLHRAYLAPKTSLALVEVAGEVLVIGISGQNVSMLTKLESEDSLTLVRKESEGSFVSHLSRMMSKQDKADNGNGNSNQNLSAGKINAALVAYEKKNGDSTSHSNGEDPVSRGNIFPEATINENAVGESLKENPAPSEIPLGEKGGALLKERLGRISYQLTKVAPA